MPYSSSGVVRGGRGSRSSMPAPASGPAARNDVADDGQRMLVILGEMIDHARLARMQVAAAQILGADLLARRRLHQRRAGEEDRALVADDDALVAHRRHIGAAGGAAAHHAGDLGDALRAHLRLVEEDPAEMVAVGEDLGLVRQVRAAAVDQVDARQPVLASAISCARRCFLTVSG